MGSAFAFVMWFLARSNGAAGFPDTRANHWVYEGLAKAKRDGLLVGYPDGLVYHEPPKNRYAMAVPPLFAIGSYRDLAAAMPREREAAQALGPADARWAAYDDDHRYVLSLRRHLPFLRRAEVEFPPQILELREAVPSGVASVAEAERAANRVWALGPAVSDERRQPFRDVPRSHWAASAIGDLRAWGLIEGYPDRCFGG